MPISIIFEIVVHFFVSDNEFKAKTIGDRVKQCPWLFGDATAGK